MANSILTSDQDSIVVEIDVAAPPERVLKAIHDPEEVCRRAPILDVYEMDARLGGRWLLEIGSSRHPQGGSSVVRWELTPTASGTHVKLTHSEIRAGGEEGVRGRMAGRSGRYQECDRWQ
ncbi:MAG: SRPBCC domain-containing protein [Terriglobales bacterium]